MYFTPALSLRAAVDFRPPYTHTHTYIQYIHYIHYILPLERLLWAHASLCMSKKRPLQILLHLQSSGLLLSEENNKWVVAGVLRGCHFVSQDDTGSCYGLSFTSHTRSICCYFTDDMAIWYDVHLFNCVNVYSCMKDLMIESCWLVLPIGKNG